MNASRHPVSAVLPPHSPGPNVEGVYSELKAKFAELDRRNTHYRFDLERDLDWKVPAADARFFPDPMLVHLGMDPQVFAGRSDLRTAFDWASALGVCCTFMRFEEKVVDFVARERLHFDGVTSVGWLVEEEVKHVRLFERYASLLRESRPEWAVASASAADAMCKELDAHLHFPAGGATEHYMFWAGTIFFEELTIAMDDYVRKPAEAVDPLWLRVHALHRREETQHVITDTACLAALQVNPDDVYEASRGFVLGAALGNYWNNFGLSLGAALVKKLDPSFSEVLPFARITQRPAFGDFLVSSKYKRSRAALPYLAELAADADDDE